MDLADDAASKNTLTTVTNLNSQMDSCFSLSLAIITAVQPSNLHGNSTCSATFSSARLRMFTAHQSHMAGKFTRAAE